MANAYQTPDYRTPMPNYYGQTPYTQPVYQPQMQPRPEQSPNSILTVFVNSEEEVNYYPVAAGVSVLLISFDLKKFYLKSTAKNGVPEPIRVFSFSEETKSEIQNEGVFVTRDELDALTAKLNSLIEKLGGDK